MTPDIPENRIARLGKALRKDMPMRSVDAIVSAVDPDASETLVSAALAWAARKCRTVAEIWDGTAAAERALAARFEEALAGRQSPISSLGEREQ